jgi:hypothetical protein
LEGKLADKNGYSSRDPAREETPQAFLLNLRGHAIPPADASRFFYKVNERAFEAC